MYNNEHLSILKYKNWNQYEIEKVSINIEVIVFISRMYKAA